MSSVKTMFIIYIFLFSLSGCFDPTFSHRLDEEFSREGKVIVYPYDAPDTPMGKAGFSIKVKLDDVRDLNAPNGEKFKKVLQNKISEIESRTGRKICVKGYFILNNFYYYHGIYAIFTAECLP